LTDYTIKRLGNWGFIEPTPDATLTKRLVDTLSYEKKNSQFIPKIEWRRVKLYNPKRACFPWGLRKLASTIVASYANTQSSLVFFDPSTTFQKVYYDDLTDLDSNLRPYQRAAIDCICKCDGGVLNMPTGSGKTKVAINFLREYKKQALVVVTTLDLVTQWNKLVRDIPWIKVSNYQNPKLPLIMPQFDVVVFDECHHVSAKTVFNLASKTKTRCMLIGLSATPYREDGNDMKILAALGEVSYRITRQELIQQGFLVNAEVQYYKYVTLDDFRFSSYAEVYESVVVQPGFRNDKVLEVIRKFPDKKVLVLVQRVAHGELLASKVAGSLFLSGSVKERDLDFSVHPVIIATSIFDEGIDLPFVDVLVIAAGGKSSVRLVQRVGRVLRLFPGKGNAIICDFVDEAKYLKAHYLKRRAILGEDFEVVTYE